MLLSREDAELFSKLHCALMQFVPRQQNLWADSSGSGRRPNV